MDGTIIYFLDSGLNILAAVDQYKSAIFTARYNTPGDFQIYLPATAEVLELAKSAEFVTRAEDTTVCGVIERISITTSAEEGDFVTIAGRDAAALLERRIVWRQTTYTGNAEKIVRDMIEKAFISPEVAARTVSNFELAEEIGLAEDIQAQYSGDNVSNAVQAICKTTGTGYRIRLDLENRRFIFELYQGTDRSFAQNENAYVVFSEDFDNLLSTAYEENNSTARNVAQVAGEGQGKERVKVSVGSVTGIERRETYINAQTKSSNQQELDAETYAAVLRQDGTNGLAQLIATKQIDGEIAPNYTFIFGRDYFLGDIIEVMNQYGVDMQPRIIEVTESWADDGYTCIPKFEKPGAA